MPDTSRSFERAKIAILTSSIHVSFGRDSKQIENVLKHGVELYFARDHIKHVSETFPSRHPPLTQVSDFGLSHQFQVDSLQNTLLHAPTLSLMRLLPSPPQVASQGLVRGHLENLERSSELVGHD